MPAPGPNGKPIQFIDVASIAMLVAKALASKAWTSRTSGPSGRIVERGGELGPAIDDWLAMTGHTIAYVIVTSSSFIKFESTVIDG